MEQRAGKTIQTPITQLGTQIRKRPPSDSPELPPLPEDEDPQTNRGVQVPERVRDVHYEVEQVEDLRVDS